MDSGAPLDHARFHLSPGRTRCELFVTGGGHTERIASGFSNPFPTHLNAAEEQAPSVRLEVAGQRRVAWFSKGTLERFVRFVSTPDVLETVNALDAEMSQLEGARSMYSQGVGDDQHLGSLGENEAGTSIDVDLTKRELLRAIRLRLVAVKQDLTKACARAAAAGFTLSSVSELHLFAEHFGAHRLSAACTNFTSVCQRRPELTSRRPHHRNVSDDHHDDTTGARSSGSNDMSIDDELDNNAHSTNTIDPIVSSADEMDITSPTTTSLAGSGSHRRQDDDDRVPPLPSLTQKRKPILRRSVSSLSDKPARSIKLGVPDPINNNITTTTTATRSFSNKLDASADKVRPKALRSHRRSLSIDSVGLRVKETQFRTMKLHHQTSAPIQFDSPRFYPMQGPASCSSPQRPARNDELWSKADELERLFAAQQAVASRRRGDPARLGVDREARAAEKRPEEVPAEEEGSSTDLELDGDLPMIGSQNYDHDMMQKVGGGLSRGEGDGRGKFYERYMQKRDAKLREEWRAKRTQKEASLKAMQDRIEQTQAEVKALFSGCCGTRDMVLRTESLRSSAVESKEQTLEYIQSEEEYELQELSEQVRYDRDRYNDGSVLSDSSTSIDSNKFLLQRNKSSTALVATGKNSLLPVRPTNSGSQATVVSLQGEEEDDLIESYKQVQFRRNKTYSSTTYPNGPYRSTDSNKLMPSRSVSSSMTLTSVASTHKPTVKATSSGAVRQRTQPENPLKRSSSSHAGVRKENTKPSNGTGKVTTHASSGNLPRGKRTNTGVIVSKEEKPQRSQSLRKNYADVSPLNPNSGNMTPVRLSKEPGEQLIKRSSSSKPFLRKSSGTVPGAGADSAKSKDSLAYETLGNGQEFESFLDRRGYSPVMVSDEDEDFARTSGSHGAVHFPGESDSEDPMSSLGSRTSRDPRLEYNDVMKPLEQSVESPGSWSSHIQHSFSYIHEASDLAVSADSPKGSPASWNSHPLNKMREAEAVRIRKKWGNAQNPFSVSSSSRQSPKDATKGFKRLLNFAKKSKGAESGVTDGVSASRDSEGDYDTEDGYGLACQSVEYPRMSRMDYLIPDYECFSAVDILPEQVSSSPSFIKSPANARLREDHQSSTPKAQRSLFSVPSFRNRGTESKLR